MEASKTISVGGWDFGEEGTQILTEFNIESVEKSENLIPRTTAHGSLVGNSFFSRQRVHGKVLFIADSISEAFDKARMFNDFVSTNFYSNNGGLLKFEIGDRHGFGVFSSFTPCEFSPLLKQGGASVEFEFTFTHPYFYSNNITTYSFNSDSVEKTQGLSFPAREFRFFHSKGVRGVDVRLVNNGSVPAPLKIVFPHGGVDPVINIGGRRLEFLFNTSSEVVIDAKNQTILLGGRFSPSLLKFGTSLKDVFLPVAGGRLSVTGRGMNGGSVDVVVEYADTFQNI